MQGRVFEATEEDPNADVDGAALKVLDQEPWKGRYDLIGDLVGIGVYTLERLPKASGRLILVRVLDHLESLSIP